MNILEYYKSGGNPEWLPELRQRYKSDYKRWTAILNSIYYTKNIRVGREGMRAAVADRAISSHKAVCEYLVEVSVDAPVIQARV